MAAYVGVTATNPKIGNISKAPDTSAGQIAGCARGLYTILPWCMVRYSAWDKAVGRLRSIDPHDPPTKPRKLAKLLARSGLRVQITTMQTCHGLSRCQEDRYIKRYRYPILETPESDSDAVKIEPYGDNQELVQDPKNGRYRIHYVARYFDSQMKSVRRFES